MTDNAPAPDPDTPNEPELVDLALEADRDAAGLQPMERRFCIHALELIGSGERHWRQEAARRAGYKEPRGAAHQLIRRPRVVQFMSRHMTEAAETVNVDRSFVLFRALANMTACEATGDYRTAHRYLDIIAKHADVGAFNRPGSDGGDAARAGMMSLPFDPAQLSTDELSQMLSLMRKAAGGKPTV